MTRAIIETQADVDRAAHWLAGAEPRFAAALALTGPLPLRRKPQGFVTLLDAIISQQVSTASAAAIRARMQMAGLCDEAALRRAGDEELRAVGLSRPKMRYARALAGARLDYAGLAGLPDAQLLATLTCITGIGLWTAEVYALQALGRADVFPAGDVALQESARRLFDLPERPGETALRRLAAGWAPQRAVAARLLWAYYRVSTAREGIR
ncbi:DNA-3-methyladenine glycosylase 2 family protein [Aliiroseovarius sp.]|uniref:DNA-3-methyladenine glycosylase family protein n=1 Tax=Aliiroseovarius sp. TaxID=1872442 RepID=UPI002633E1EF|nr:DNA-3-methyladenine glycosylase 2 family protein [Aliiroseovarius sp.]